MRCQGEGCLGTGGARRCEERRVEGAGDERVGVGVEGKAERRRKVSISRGLLRYRVLTFLSLSSRHWWTNWAPVATTPAVHSRRSRHRTGHHRFTTLHHRVHVPPRPVSPRPRLSTPHTRLLHPPHVPSTAVVVRCRRFGACWWWCTRGRRLELAIAIVGGKVLGGWECSGGGSEDECKGIGVVERGEWVALERPTACGDRSGRSEGVGGCRVRQGCRGRRGGDVLRGGGRRGRAVGWSRVREKRRVGRRKVSSTSSRSLRKRVLTRTSLFSRYCYVLHLRASSPCTPPPPSSRPFTTSSPCCTLSKGVDALGVLFVP